MNKWLAEYFRCPPGFLRVQVQTTDPSTRGYFRVGADATCFGKYFKSQTSKPQNGSLPDASGEIEIRDGSVYLPFDPSEVAENLQREVYAEDWRAPGAMPGLTRLYYLIRPALPVGVRRHLQKMYLSGWKELVFPKWPVDCSLEHLAREILLLVLKASGEKRIPFIWFWPDAASSCAIMTHDVETRAGRNFCPALMDMDESYGIKSSFQVIPEHRYAVSPDFLSSIRKRGFEIGVHDLNHDGHLYRDREEFLQRAAKINSYRKEYGAEGFRAAVLYRKQIWYDALEFAFDMSVPNVAHLDPQRGGCCTVMPYFIGEILELPVTATQDYMLFYILNDYSIDLWKKQVDLIMRQKGLMSFIVHADYIRGSRERKVYEQLLEYLVQLREQEGVWTATPGQVNQWWRQRAEMELVETPSGWKIEGPGRERARVAYAHEDHGQLALTLEDN